jgi:hypothetical protein
MLCDWKQGQYFRCIRGRTEEKYSSSMIPVVAYIFKHFQRHCFSKYELLTVMPNWKIWSEKWHVSLYGWVDFIGFFFTTMSRPDQTQPPIKWVMGVNVWSYTSTPSLHCGSYLHLKATLPSSWTCQWQLWQFFSFTSLLLSCPSRTSILNTVHSRTNPDMIVQFSQLQ